ncbi:MAG: UDP-forming cellulose synthase catalytic subunit [Pseudomonadota bacterium]
MKYLVRAGWMIFILLAIAVVTQPIGLNAQILYGVVGVGVMIIIHLLKLKGVMRHIFLAIAVSIALRYVYWRLTTTLPPADDLLSFIPAVLLLIAEVYSITMLFISVTVSSDPLTRKPQPLRGSPSDYPSIDVFIPSYNEDDDLLGVTMAACVNMKYPRDKLNVYLCDDGGTDQKCADKDPGKRHDAIERRKRLSRLCKEMGVHYRTRAKNNHAKAGNMNEALKTSSGDIILVFDADHAPVRDFLIKTVGHFQHDPKLFLVQTPHFFLNPDPVEKNLGTYSFMPSENEMFYQVTQKGLDKWDASFFCGSGALLKRDALNEVGGFSGITITEDCETALDLHSRGWSSAYVDEPMLAGFQPETMDAFLTQRSRWCQGMVQIFLLKPPFFKKGLSFMQRISYLSSMSFWFFPLSRLCFMFAPMLYIFFNLEIYNASFQEFMAYTGILMASAVLTQNYLYHSVRWPWISETYEYIQSVHLAPVIFSTLWKPRAPSFKVTDKGITLEKDFFSSKGWVFLVIFLLLLVACIVALYRLWLDNFTNELLMVVGIWSVFNLVLGGLALGVCAEKKELRRHYRLEAKVDEFDFELDTKAGKKRLTPENYSIGGIGMIDQDRRQGGAKLEKGMHGILRVISRKTKRPIHAFNVSVSWHTPNDIPRIGVQFVNPTAKDRRLLAYLMLPGNGQLKEIMMKRRTRRPIWQGTGAIIAWSFDQVVRGSRAIGGELVKMRKKEEKAAE